MFATASAQQPDAQTILQLLLQRGAATQQPLTNAPQLTRMAEADLARSMAAWPPIAQRLTVERRRDGFIVNGQRVVDAEGRIVQYAYSSATGDITYVVETLPSQFVLKAMRFGNPPIAIASGVRTNGVWSIETVSGQRLNGKRLVPTPRGFVLARENVLFRYEPGVGISNAAAPDDYDVAALQPGDIGGTSFVLLERRLESKEAQQSGGLAGAIGLGQVVAAARSIGSKVGLAESESDFALYSFVTGKLVPLRISLDDKRANFYKQCRQRNDFLRQCEQMESMDSVWEQNGSRNLDHYYWRVNWFATEHGPIAVTMEDGIRRIDVVALESDRRATVFERALGISGWDAEQTPDGRIRVSANLAFERAVNDDVAALLTASQTTKEPTSGAPLARTADSKASPASTRAVE
jgi:hypothetical protein